MGVETPGTRRWLRTLKAEFDPALPATAGIPLGGQLHKQVVDPRIKPGSRAYRAALRAEAGETILMAIAGRVDPLAITSPTAGSTVPPVHDVVGNGAIPGADVELWHVENDRMVATVPPDAEGNWIFGGDTPATLGEVSWQVRQGPRVSPPVTITVAEEEPEPPLRSRDDDDLQPEGAWESMTRHDQLDGYVAGEGIIPPVGWDAMKIADKKAWLDEHY